MDIADVVMIAEDSWAARHERQEQAFERARVRLHDEFMEALNCPLLANVSTTKGRRYPVTEVLFENLAFNKYQSHAAAAVSILMRDPLGKKICESMAWAHADDYAEGDDE